jgi:HAD superfamily hydrolase (TIGR01509 family)
MKAVLLDLGGVIIDIDPRRTLQAWADAAGADVAQVSSRWAIDATYEAHETNRIGFTELTAHLSKRLGISISQQAWLDGWNQLFLEEFAGVVARIEEAARRVPLFVYTNTNPEHQAEWETRYAKSLQPFRKIYVSSEIGLRKPYVESYRWVANDMGFAPEDIMFLDDNTANIKGAQEAGMQTLHVTGSDVTEALLDKVIDHFPLDQ